MIKGKGIYAWRLERCEDGDMAEVVKTLKRAGMTHIIPKIADGSYEYKSNTPYLKNLVTLAHREGIQVIPYQFVYGSYPESEAIRAIEELRKYPYDGFVINGEAAYKALANPSDAAKRYCEALRRAFSDLMLCLSTYRYPSLHREFPFRTFLDYVDVNMPQVYWMQANGTVPHQLERTMMEYMQFPDVPIIPTGAAFKEWGWVAIPDDQRIFIEQVKMNELSGCNWWEYYHAFNLLPQLGQAIIDTPFEVDEPEPVEPAPEPPDDTFWAKCTATYALTIRSTPRVETGNIVGYLMRDEKRLVYEESGIWWRIGEDQWVSSNYMERLPDPVEPPPPPMTLEERVADNTRRIEILEGKV